MACPTRLPIHFHNHTSCHCTLAAGITALAHGKQATILESCNLIFPRFQSKGRIDEANQILADLENTDVNNAFIVTESNDIQWAVNYEKEHNVRWRDLLRGRTGDQKGVHAMRRMIMGMGTQAMQQFCK